MRGRPASPEGDEAEQQHGARAQNGELGEQDVPHRQRNDEVIAKSASTKDTLNSSGTRNSLSLAMRVSKTAMMPASATSFTSKVTRARARAAGVSATAMHQGTKRLASSMKNTRSFTDAAHSIRAR